MKKKSRICITFAGAVGSSKTPIASYLSAKLFLPVYNNDAVRSEVIEDCGFLDVNEHIKRRNQRIGEILESGTSFICDASVDREWQSMRGQLQKYGYSCFIISLDLGRDFLEKLYIAKGYTESLERIDELIKEHDIFLSKHSEDISLHLTEIDFEMRLEKSLSALRMRFAHMSDS